MMRGVPFGARERALAALAACLAAAACASGEAAHAGRSAVLFIVDGMGSSYVTATRIARAGSAGRLHLDAMPRTALVRTHAADSPVTDSAAAASAMACGQKAVNGVICQDASAVYGERDGRRLEPIGLWAGKRGVRVGVVTTAALTDATAAAFYAVHNNRDHQRSIARQAIGSGLAFILGGGRRYFGAGPPAVEEDGWSPTDAEDLEATARARGWRLVDSAAALRAVTSLETPVLGLFAPVDLPFEAGGREKRTAPTLVEMTGWAIGALTATGGPFLLVVEAGRPDHAGHANWARTLVDEMAALDAAVGQAMEKLDPKTTLLLVTGDHETGGLAINGYPDEKDGIWSTYRPRSGDDPYPVVTFASGPGLRNGSRPAPHGPDDPRPSGIPLRSGAHTAVDVPLYAWGAGSDGIHGTIENTAIYSILRSTLEGKDPVLRPADRAPR
jgi:alkaline phosphatase